MPTSGSVDFSINENEIIKAALEICSVAGIGKTIAAADYQLCRRRLNLMVKAWMATGYHLWAMSEATLFLSPGTQTYSLGAGHCTNNYVHTTLTADAANGATSIAISSASGMANSDFIGIVLDSGEVHWTTISSSGLTTTLATGLAGAASEGAVVFAYTTKITRPVRLISAYRRSIDNNDIPIEIIGRQRYSEIANKLSEGKTNQVFYDPQLTAGVLYAWQTPDLATDVIRFWYERTLEDFDAVTNTPDFPIEWGEALIYNLADRVSTTYQVSLQERQWIKAEAAASLSAALAFDSEGESVFFQPNMDGHA